jgi:chromosome segregation ATPase
MPSLLNRLFLPVAAVGMSVASLYAAEAEVNPVEQKLRESLRSTMLQLRDAQGQVAVLQAAQLESEQKIKDLTGQLDKTVKQAAEDKKASERAITQLTVKNGEQDARLARFVESQGKWKKAYESLAEIAKSTEAARAKVEAEAIALQRRVNDQRTKNEAMYKLGMEVLDRYKNFGLGNALVAREPFVGVTRVKFENLIQDYENKLSDQTIKTP